MIIFGKIVKLENCFLFISFVVVSLCLSMIIILAQESKISAGINLGIYSGNQRNFEIYNANNNEAWNDVIENMPEYCNDFTISFDIKDSIYTVKGLYVRGKVVEPPLIDGNYFDESTSWSDVPNIIIGKEFANSIFVREKIKYYNYFGVECRVIGIMGTENDSRINHMIILDMKTALKLSDINTNYIYDSYTKESLNSIGRYIYESFSKPIYVNIMLDSNELNLNIFDDVFSRKKIISTMYVMVLISNIISIMLVSANWIKKKKSLIKVWNICGFDDFNKIFGIVTRYSLYSFGGSVVGVMLLLILSQYINNIVIDVVDVSFIFLLTNFVGIFIVILLFFRLEFIFSPFSRNDNKKK